MNNKEIYYQLKDGSPNGEVNIIELEKMIRQAAEVIFNDNEEVSLKGVLKELKVFQNDDILCFDLNFSNGRKVKTGWRGIKSLITMKIVDKNNKVIFNEKELDVEQTKEFWSQIENMN